MLRETRAKGIVKKGHATTLHSLIRINRKFGDRISAVQQEESAARRVINHANTLLSLLLLVGSQHMCTGHLEQANRETNYCRTSL